MFKPVRVVASIVFLASIAMIFVSAFVIKNDVRIHLLFLPHALTYYISRLSALVCSPHFVHLITELTLILVFVIVEYLAYTWYTLSYIPYARTAVLKVFGM